MPTQTRATLDELLVFANKVREAGGGNALDALMPATPSNKQQCLIAKNLNFNCEVGGAPYAADHQLPLVYSDTPAGNWFMTLDDKGIRDRIAESLDLETYDGVRYHYSIELGYHNEYLYSVRLPESVGQVASDYDRWSEALRLRRNPVTGKLDEIYIDGEDDEIERLREFAPYVEASIRDTLGVGIFDEEGKLLL